jgi:hypothetical protein
MESRKTSLLDELMVVKTRLGSHTTLNLKNNFIHSSQVDDVKEKGNVGSEESIIGKKFDLESN